MHGILQRQLKKHNIDAEILSEELKNLILEISSTYEHFDDDRKLMERSLDLSSHELRDANLTLEASNLELKNLDQKKDEFISVAAHELKTPLTSIRGLSQLLQTEEIANDSEKRAHFLSIIDKNSEALYSLVLDIIDTSRLSLGQMHLNIEPLDVYSILEETKLTTESVIKNKGLACEFQTEKNLPKIIGDRIRILQILKNLIINSVHYTEKGEIKVSIKNEDGFLCFAVSDTGQGIPDDFKKNIFTRFNQLDSSLTRKIGGSGLGLSICKGIVENMGGTIWFESKIGKGTTFFFNIPIQK